MLYRIEVITDRGTELVLPLEMVSEGYYVKDVEGLDPVKANIVSSSFALLDGAQYQSSRRESRNIILKMGLELGVAPVRQLRNRLYTYLMPKSKVRLRFFLHDMPTVEIEGRVEEFTSPLFTSDPEITISLLCFEPDFYSIDTNQIPGATTSGEEETLIQYDGSVETGVVFTLHLNRDHDEGFSITHRAPDDSISTLDFVAPLYVGDELEISTVSGNKGATLTRMDTSSSLLYGITPHSNWINLFPGPNHIRIHAGGVSLPYTITYTTKYGGL